MWGSDAGTGIDALSPVPAEVISSDYMHQGMADARPLCTDRLAAGARGRTTTGQPARRPRGGVRRRKEELLPRREVINEEILHEARQFLRRHRDQGATP